MSGFIFLICFINRGKALRKRCFFKLIICSLFILASKGPEAFIKTRLHTKNLLSKFSNKLNVTFSAPPPAKEGKIIKTGDASLAKVLEEKGYEWLKD